ncbi:magnesium transporter CorA family protein [Gordonia sp. NPDC003425]
MGAEHVRGQIWRHGEKVDGFDLASISDLIDEPDTLVWADLDCPSHPTLNDLADELDLDPFAIEDTIAAAERVKAVTYAHHVFVMVYAVDRVGDVDHPLTEQQGDHDDAPPPVVAGPIARDRKSKSFSLHRISIFMKGNAFITVRLRPGFDMDAVVDRWEEIDAARLGPSALLYGLLDVVVDGHFDAVQRLDDQIEGLEEMLFDERIPNRALQMRTYDLRKDLVVLRRVILPMREVLATIERHRAREHANSELDPHYADLYDHTLRAAEWTESLRDMVSTVFETNLSLADARLNTVMKKLTAWAAIIAVPTAITGFYGQNVPYPGFSQWSGFVVSSVLIVVIVTALYVNFRHRDWL